MDEAAGALGPEQIEMFWDLCDSQLYSASGRWFTEDGRAPPSPEEEHLEAEREARRLWARAEGLPGGAEALLRGAPFDADYFLYVAARPLGKKWASPEEEARKFRVARWLLSLRGGDGSRWEGFAPERLLRSMAADPEVGPGVPAFVVSVADGEGHAWTPRGAELRAAALARNAPAGGPAAEAAEAAEA
jgi:hypothetical protein